LNLPLFNPSDPQRPVLWLAGRSVTVGELMRSVAAVAAALPQGRYLLNLCERRDTFLIAYCAALVREHTNLLPPSRAQDVVSEVERSVPGSYRCDDRFVLDACQKSPALNCHFQVPGNHIAAMAFTSGSTGTPQAHSKRMGSFTRVSELNASRIRECLADEALDTRLPWMVATVPPQHMYGLETSVLLPLLGNMAIHAGRPLFPADIAAALAETPEPRVLVSTPIHLRAIAASDQNFPPTALVISATAPLDVGLAQALEQRLDTTILEMFGSTETCVIATRRTAHEDAWRLYTGVSLDPHSNGTRVRASWFESAVLLQDILELQVDGRFMVRGRNADMVEVAGKRASLADLTQRLLRVPGVQDAVVFQPDTSTTGLVQRVAALAVAPGVDAAALCAQLARGIDAAFIPRPLRLVQALPRNELGKLPRERLLALLSEAGSAIQQFGKVDDS